ncbi:PP2C family protein-serine/threonine phosphatase, partial [candidate division KSB1 bacterium]
DSAIGIDQKSKYNMNEIEINKSEMMFVYSDGITEARNEKGEFFGDDRLKNMIPELKEYSAKFAGEHILKVIDRFIEEAPQNDDISLIILKRK